MLTVIRTIREASRTYWLVEAPDGRAFWVTSQLPADQWGDLQGAQIRHGGPESGTPEQALCLCPKNLIGSSAACPQHSKPFAGPATLDLAAIHDYCHTED